MQPSTWPPRTCHLVPRKSTCKARANVLATCFDLHISVPLWCKRLVRRPLHKMEAFAELALAPTNRAACAVCKRRPDMAHKIEMGELVIKSHYVPAGRNHFQSTSSSLACISKKRMANMLGDDGAISAIRGFGSLPPSAQEVAVKMAESILANAPIDDALKLARFHVEKKRKRDDCEKRVPTPEPTAKPVETIAMPSSASFDIFADESAR